MNQVYFISDGEAGVTRTLGPLLRRQMLYPTELQPHRFKSLIIITQARVYFKNNFTEIVITHRIQAF